MFALARAPCCIAGVAPASGSRAAFPPARRRSRCLRRTNVRRGAVKEDGGGAGVLERPGLDRSQPDGAPTTESGLGSSDTVRGKKLGGGAYRVLLLDSPQHTEKLVVHVITTVVTGTSEEHALNCHATARKLGQAIVTSCLQEHAEFYALQMAKSGVKCTIEPDSTVI